MGTLVSRVSGKSFAKRIKVAFLVIALVAVSGCQAADTSADQESGAKKVANYEGGEITEGEVQEQMNLLAQQTGQGEIKPGSPQYDQALQQVMPQLVTVEMARAYAQDENISVSEQEIDKGVDQQMEQIKSQVAQQAASQGQNLGKEEAFEQALKQANLTEDKLRSDIREQIPDSLLLQKVQKDVVSGVQVSDQEVKDFYEQNESQFAQDETRCTRHILFNKDQEQKAEGVKAQLENGGDFASLAKENSQDPGSADKGGDLGCIGKGETVPSFEKAVFKAQTGEIVGPVESDFGYHVIEVTDIKEPQTQSLSEVEGQIRSQLEAEQKGKKFTKWLEDEKKQRDIQYLSDKYKVSGSSPSVSTATPQSQ